jgi:hypothetical protein
MDATTATRAIGEGLVTQTAHAELPQELQDLVVRAESLADDRALYEAFDTARRDAGLWARAQADPWGYLRERGVDVPEGLAVRFVRPNAIGRPTPDHPYVAVRVSRCRTAWVRNADGTGIEEVEVCWGYEIVPYPLPPIG